MTDDERDPANPRLADHLGEWLGAWPPPPGQVLVVGSGARLRGGWDGNVRSVLGVATADAAVVSVVPERAAAARTALAGVGRHELLAALPEAVGLPGGRAYAGVFRWRATAPDATLEPLGRWVDPSDPSVPPWLRPFQRVLLHQDDDGAYLAGVGVKAHDRFGAELSVGTEPEGRGLGLGRRLVAEATRVLVGEGLVVTYLHAPDNHASAAVAVACGFPDEGWQVLGVA